MSTISILLIDANPTFQRMTTRLLRDYYSEDVTVVGTSPGYTDAVAQAKALKPAMILLGQDHHGLFDLHLLACLRESLPHVGIIILERFDMQVNRQSAMAAGANGFVAKSTLSTTLLPAIWHVIEENGFREVALDPEFRSPEQSVQLIGLAPMAE